MNALVLYAVIAQQPEVLRSDRDGVPVRRRRKRPARPNAARTLL